MEFNGLGQINIELSSRCNKSCWMCGRRQREKLYEDQSYGDIDFDLLEKIADQVPSGIMIAFHNNGEGLLYTRFGEAVKLFTRCITYIVTNGKLLVDKADEIIEKLDILSVSIIEGENEEEKREQVKILKQFLRMKGGSKPYVTLRFVGDVFEDEYKEFDLPKVRRLLHMPEGSVGFKFPPTRPEHGVCQDLLNRLAIDRYGNVSPCVRFDPDRELVLGNIKDKSLVELWNSEKRKWMIDMQVRGKRQFISFCGDKCEFWGVPTGGE